MRANDGRQAGERWAAYGRMMGGMQANGGGTRANNGGTRANDGRYAGETATRANDGRRAGERRATFGRTICGDNECRVIGDDKQGDTRDKSTPDEAMLDKHGDKDALRRLSIPDRKSIRKNDLKNDLNRRDRMMSENERIIEPTHPKFFYWNSVGDGQRQTDGRVGQQRVIDCFTQFLRRKVDFSDYLVNYPYSHDAFLFPRMDV
ncbi:hypothetical protein KIN20_033393 [Parelaphostrongylus tenuis]|uniref:Uncharacterized protein n=1 Tax=Parelaphostrongylus tenuis TaxID=148309 RepID=A0AAD5R7Z8_PARTN|nr:hypothetical protein KIN20_033393 [Parelaphostrongylus tenuis]